MWGSGSVPQRPKGGLEPEQFSLPEPPVWDMDILGRLAHEPSPLKVDLSSTKPRDQMPVTQALHTASTSPSSPHSVIVCPSGTTTSTSMAAELHKLLSQAMLNTSSSVPGHTTPRRLTSVAPDTPPSMGVKDPLGLETADLAVAKPMATSS